MVVFLGDTQSDPSDHQDGQRNPSQLLGGVDQLLEVPSHQCSGRSDERADPGGKEKGSWVSEF